MQSIDWDDDNVPPIFLSIDNPDECFFFDRPTYHAFAAGDQIVHLSEVGPSVYRVVSVTPEYDADSEYYADVISDYTRVTIRPA